jgi:hypothetical protein
MSGSQHAVLWLGLSLIIVKLLTTGGWSAMWGTLKNGTSLTAPSSTGGVTGAINGAVKNGQQQQQQVTGLPFVPAL